MEHIWSAVIIKKSLHLNHEKCFKLLNTLTSAPSTNSIPDFQIFWILRAIGVRQFKDFSFVKWNLRQIKSLFMKWLMELIRSGRWKEKLCQCWEWTLMEVVAGEPGVWSSSALCRVVEIIFTLCSCRAGDLIASRTDPEYITMHPWSVINGLVEFSSMAKPSRSNIRESSWPQFSTTWATKIKILNDVIFCYFCSNALGLLL